MEKSNGKIIAVAALVVAVLALSVGFAAFADQLNISGQARFIKTDAFDAYVKYVGTPSCVDENGNNVITSGYSVGTFSNDDDTWSGISVPLSTAAGKSKVTCTASVENRSAYDAYLQSIGVSSGLTCAAYDSNNDPVSNLADVCGAENANVKATVIIGDSVSSTDKIEVQYTQQSKTNTCGSIDAIDGSTVDTTNVYVIFEYLGSAEPDGDVLITLPSVTHSYSTVENASCSAGS